MKPHLFINAGFKNNKTYLQSGYCSHPFKIANVTEDKSKNLLRLMITSSSPGILSNDHLAIKIIIEENAALHLTTQGYQRLFTMASNASQKMDVDIENNGSLCFLPHPNVPHKASDFSSVNNIYLNEKHNLLWSEIITCGRKLNGEEFKFTKFKNVTTIYINQKLVVKENVMLAPLKSNVHSIGQLEGYSHQSTLIFMHDAADTEKIVKDCIEFLSKINDITFGISALPVNGFLVRILGYKGELLFNTNNELAICIQQLTNKNFTTDSLLST